MTTNQTIDGVPRSTLEIAIGDDGLAKAAAIHELRALLGAPAPRAEFKKIEMAHVMNALEDVRGKPVLTSNQCHDLARALNDRLLSPLQLLAMPAEYLAAAQPQGEPVAWMDPRSPEMHATISNEVKQHNLKFGGAPSAAVNGYSIPLYAEQPAPVAVVLPARPRADEEEYERMTDYEKGLLHGGIELWDKIDEAIRLAAKS